jgi:hypothetical protein
MRAGLHARVTPTGARQRRGVSNAAIPIHTRATQFATKSSHPGLLCPQIRRGSSLRGSKC